MSYTAGQTYDQIATNFIVGAAEGVAFGGIFSVGAKFVSLGRFAKFAPSLENIPVLRRLGIAGSLFPGKKLVGEKLTFLIDGERIVVSSGVKLGQVVGGGKHFMEILGTGATAGQTTLAEVLLLEEAEAALTTAVREGLIDTAVFNALELGAGTIKYGTPVIVQTAGFTWEIVAKVVVENGQRIIKVFHLQPI